MPTINGCLVPLIILRRFNYGSKNIPKTTAILKPGKGKTLFNLQATILSPNQWEAFILEKEHYFIHLKEIF